MHFFHQDCLLIEKSWLKLYSVASRLLHIDKLVTLRQLLHFMTFSTEDHLVHIKKVLGILPMKQDKFFPIQIFQSFQEDIITGPGKEASKKRCCDDAAATVRGKGGAAAPGRGEVCAEPGRREACVAARGRGLRSLCTVQQHQDKELFRQLQEIMPQV